VEQQSEERALRDSQQEHTRQLQQQHRFSGGGVHSFRGVPANPDAYSLGTFKDAGRSFENENQRDPPPVASAVKGERRPAK
jgi:hypothetical protein